MTSNDVSSPDKSPKSSLDEQHLPLYEEFQEDAASADTLPEAKATPNQVREFIANLLVTRRNLPIDYARRAAAKWTVGSGRELRSYTPSMYLGIFGREDGWIIYREVHLTILYNHKMQQGPLRRNIFCMLSSHRPTSSQTDCCQTYLSPSCWCWKPRSVLYSLVISKKVFSLAL